MLFYQIGELFQSYAVGKSRRSITALMDIRPDYANIEQDGKLVQVDPDDVAVGSIIVVQPGEKVPLDGVVTEGSSTLNTAALTGESARDAAAGDEVISGCVNMTGVLKIRTTKALRRIYRLQNSGAGGELQLPQIPPPRTSSPNLPASTPRRLHRRSGAGGAAAGGAAGHGSQRRLGHLGLPRLTFLVISCPCALVISIPLSFFAGLGGASRAGVLVKGSNYLETLSKTRVVVFDKTGTLTQGVFDVTGVHHNTMPQKKVLEYAALAEWPPPIPSARASSGPTAARSTVTVSRTCRRSAAMASPPRWTAPT